MGFIVAIYGHGFLDKIFDTLPEAQNAAENALDYPYDHCAIYKIEEPIVTGVPCVTVDWMNWEEEYCFE